MLSNTICFRQSTKHQNSNLNLFTKLLVIYRNGVLCTCFRISIFTFVILNFGIDGYLGQRPKPEAWVPHANTTNNRAVNANRRLSLMSGCIVVFVVIIVIINVGQIVVGVGGLGEGWS